MIFFIEIGDEIFLTRLFDLFTEVLRIECESYELKCYFLFVLDLDK